MNSYLSYTTYLSYYICQIIGDRRINKLRSSNGTNIRNNTTDIFLVSDVYLIPTYNIYIKNHRYRRKSYIGVSR